MTFSKNYIEIVLDYDDSFIPTGIMAFFQSDDGAVEHFQDFSLCQISREQSPWIIQYFEGDDLKDSVCVPLSAIRELAGIEMEEPEFYAYHQPEIKEFVEKKREMVYGPFGEMLAKTMENIQRMGTPLFTAN